VTAVIDLITSLRWQDILDIILNSYILFRLYVLFRSTNVIRMLLAICMLWVLKRLAVSMGLIVTSWVIQGIIAVAALIIIIVFRNEIAGVFQARSIRSFFWGIPQRPLQTPVDVIVESVDELARRGLGALLVMPLSGNTGDAMHGGIQWQGRLSQEMLLSIFWHGSPVHDGAAVIRGDQVLTVGTILPLSKDKNLPSHFGTRHRAAAGMAEKTDAMIIVVSEERADISVFRNTTHIAIKDSFHLNRVLHEQMGTTTDNKALTSQAFEFTAAALGCLVFITAIWFSFARGVETLATLEVPVEFTNRPADMKLFSASASSVNVQISGSGSLIRAIRPEQLNVRLSLGNAVPGDNEISIHRKGIILPPGIDLKRVEPETLVVNLDVPAEKLLPLQPNWTGKLAPGLIMTQASVSPEKVKIVGGNLTVRDLRTLYTEHIPLDTISASGTTETGLMLLPSSLELVDTTLKKVKITYKVQRRPVAVSSDNP